MQSICSLQNAENSLGFHSVISPKTFWKKSGFSKGFCLGEKSLFKVPGEKEFWEGVWIFRFLLVGSLIFDNLQRLQSFQTWKFLRSWWNKAQIVWCLQIWMKIHEKVICGGNSLLKMSREKSFWGEIENFRFCLGGGLTLDGTMVSSIIFSHKYPFKKKEKCNHLGKTKT